MNEAVALAMLNEAGVATEKSAFTRFSMNGSEQILRLVIDTPDDDEWVTDHFDGNGLLYKAQAEGDYSYRGTDVSDYEDIFEQKYGEDNITPLATFLDFINNSSDEEFAESLADYLDVEAFATYLAMQDLVANDDDIDGQGNNSYLYYDHATQKMTVVAWDQNLSFGGMMGGNMKGGMMQAPNEQDGEPQMPEDMMKNGDMPFEGASENINERPMRGDLGDSADERPEMPADMEAEANDERPTNFPAEAGEGKGRMNDQNNILVSRFEANESYSALIAEQKTALTASLIDSNYASELVTTYQTLLTKEASDLVDASTVQSDGETILSYLNGANKVPTQSSVE